VCDTLCSIGRDGALFAKNSDRPSAEAQLIETHPRRKSGGRLHTSHIEIADTGAFAVVGARPEWGWGLEHGVNEHGVTIGNEKLYTRLNANKEPPALTGMDLVRLGLERGRTAGEALGAITSLLEKHGQGGICDQTTSESYFSSFLICDSRSGWVLETSGRSWAAKPVSSSAAISNRITIRKDWTRASADVEPGYDWDERRHPKAPTDHADIRLAASNACLAGGEVTREALARHLRDHGDGAWISVCMHLKGFQNTTSSIIAELPADTSRPAREWMAPGQPCVSVFLPVFPPVGVPTALGEPATWHAYEALRNSSETDPEALPRIRDVFDPLEADLWAEADAIAGQPEKQAAFIEQAWRRVWDATERLMTIRA
jgi:secernin